MGVSVSIATATVFVAFIVSFGAVTGALDEAQKSLTDAHRISSEREETMSRTDISIISIDRKNGTIELMNSGRTTLSPDSIDILLEGVLSNERVSSRTIVEHPDSKIWLPGEVLTISFDEELPNEGIKIVTGNGISIYD